MTYRVMGALPGSPLVQCSVNAVPYREINGSPGGPGAPAHNNNKKDKRNTKLGTPRVKSDMILNRIKAQIAGPSPGPVVMLASISGP